MVCKI